MAIDLEAIEQIQQLKARYFRGIDTADRALVSECLAEDVSIHFIGGSYEIEMQGADKILQFLQQAFHKDAAASHFGHHPEITISGESATGIWYLHDIFFDLARDIETSGAAIYQDRYSKINNQWKIQHTGYKRVWERVKPLENADTFTTRRLAETGMPGKFELAT